MVDEESVVIGVIPRLLIWSLQIDRLCRFSMKIRFSFLELQSSELPTKR